MSKLKSSFLLLVSFVACAAIAQAEVKKLSVDTSESFVSWVGKKVTGSHDGTVALKDGFIEMDGKNIVGGEFTLDMTSISNVDLKSSPKDQKKLEGHLKSDDFFNVNEHPTGTFKITNVIDQRNGADTGKVQMTGTLTVKDKTAPVSFPAEISMKDGKYQGTAKLVIDRSKWDIRFNSKSFFDPKKLGDKLIYDEIEIGLNILAG